MRELARYQLPGRFDSLRGRQNLLIILNTLLRKDIERAGIHPAFIDEISREYSRRIEGCISLRELGALRAEMVSAYCRLVREAGARGYSPLIQGGDGGRSAPPGRGRLPPDAGPAGRGQRKLPRDPV